VKIKFLFFFLITSTLLWGQSITGIVKDARTGEPLPFASISFLKNQGTITDIDGLFEVEISENVHHIRVQYIGYTTVEIPIQENTSFYSIALEENIEALNGVVVVADENPVLQIIANAISNKKQNNPEKVLDSYSFKAYNKLLVTANPDSINASIDSIFIKKADTLVFKELDSSNYELKKQLERSHIYISEKASRYQFTRAKGRQEVIEASRMAGFKNPIYEILALKLQSFSFYDPTYTLFGTKYTNPLTKLGLKKYRFKILDTVISQERPAYMIHYFPREEKQRSELEGVLYIDMQSYALQEIVAQLKAIIDIKATQSFEYFPQEQVWFPKQRKIQLVRGENNKGVSLFGGLVQVKGSEADSTIVRTNPSDSERLLYLLATEKNFDIALNTPLNFKKRGFAVNLSELANSRDESFWNTYRTDSIVQRDQETYTVLDSVVAAENIERKLLLGRKFLEGYYPIGIFDFDLRRLFKFNEFEGFRNGIGVVTNEKFSDNIVLNAYSVYGTRDRVFKFGLGGTVRLDKPTNTWFGAQYIDDLVESGSLEYITDGRMFSLFEPRLFNITLFHATKRFSTYLDHDVTSKIQTRIQLSTINVDPRFDYTFTNDGQSFTTYNISEVKFGIQWNPFSEYIDTPQGKKIAKNGYPQFTFLGAQSVSNVFASNFNFTKFSIRSRYNITHKNEATTRFLIKGGIGFGDIPLTHLFDTSPNQPNDDTIFGRFSVTGRESFETMFFNEFFSDRYVSGQVKHTFRPFRISNRIAPRLSLISRAAIGDVSNLEKHAGLNFNRLNQGFLESGLELNRIFAGFGLSFFYRYGAYHLPRIDDNISFKFTYYFGLGF